MTVSQISLVLDNLDSSEEYWPGALQYVPKFETVFLMATLASMAYWQEDHRGEVSFLPHQARVHFNNISY